MFHAVARSSWRARWGVQELSGERHGWLQGVLFPFRVVSYAVFAGARWTRRSEVFDEVSPGVFLEARLFPWEAEALRARGVTGVIDLTSELPTAAVFARAPFERHAVPTLDRAPPTPATMDAAVRWAVARVEAGGAVYVHCAFGRGRSGTVAAALLVALGRAKDAAERPSVRVKADRYAALEGFVARRAAG